MRESMRKIIIVLSLILILAGVNWSIAQKEQQLAEGTIAYLRLAPVDPRSLMQGDYMALRFEMASQIRKQLPKAPYEKDNWRSRNDINATDGYVVVTLDDKNIASFKAIYTPEMTLANNEIKLRYRIRNHRIKFATNAFFFQEGTGKTYSKAQFGQFRVDKNGELLLANMMDEKLVLLSSKPIL